MPPAFQGAARAGRVSPAGSVRIRGAQVAWGPRISYDSVRGPETRTIIRASSRKGPSAARANRTNTMPSGRILIVEDRDSLRRMLERALSQEGYEVAAAADGLAGIRLVEEGSFDLVLTDLKLPDVSGLEVLAASRRAQPRTPVVVLTGFGTVGTAVEAMKLGAYDFLEKPLEIDDLSRLIERALGDRNDSAVFHVPGAPAIVGRHPLL